MRAILAATVVAAIYASAANAQSPWNWNQALRPGQTLEIKGVNGHIEAVGVRGNSASVSVVKKARRNNPDDVDIVVVPNANGFTICAVYPTSRNAGRQNECRPGNGGSNSVQNNDVTVDFTVQVPEGVLFTGRSVNGSVSANGLTADTRLHTVNGSVKVSTSGVARASTVNGSIDVDLGRAVWNDLLEFETVNGRITVTLPADTDADVNASTVNGNISSDFPLTVRGRFGPRRISGTIGKGGRELSLGTVNGDIELRRR